MRLLYLCLGYCLAPIAFLRELWRAGRQPAYRDRLPTRWGFGAQLAPGAVWVHAVSVGEVTAAGPVLRRLAADYAAQPIVLTTSTATGFRQAVTLYGSRVADIRYLPYDLPGGVSRFLDRVGPRLGIILETELWPTLYRACGRRGIPLVVASARLSARSVRRYRKFRAFTAAVLGAPHVSVAAQSAEDAARFIELGADPARTVVCGNVKYDQTIAPDVMAGAAQRRETLGTARPIWVAGSTHEGEDGIVLDAHRTIRKRWPSALLVLAPRHPQRFNAVAQLLTDGGWSFVRRSHADAVTDTTEVLLLDTLGELVAYYAAADLAFVGGSLVPIGGHNLLEPLAVQCAAISGPSTSNDAATARLLISTGAVAQVADADQLAEVVAARFAEPQLNQAAVNAGLQVLGANRGAVERLLATLRPLIDRSVR